MTVAQPKVLLIGARDTKQNEIALLRSEIEASGCEIIHLDSSILNTVPGAEIPPDAVAEAAGTTIEDVRKIGHEGKCLDVMIKGSLAIVMDLFKRRQFSGVLALGGTMGTSLATSVMRALPYGVPKVMVSTMASGFTTPFVGTKDIMMVNPVTDVSGLNSINREVYRNAALAAAAMARGYSFAAASTPERPLVLIGTLGCIEQGTARVRKQLEKEGFEVMMFHTVGRGGPTLDAIVAERNVAAVLELSWTEIVDELFGGLAAAGPDRAKAGLALGVPTIFAPGNVDFILGPDLEQTSARFPGRRYHRHNPAITAVRTTLEDLKKVADKVASLASQSDGPVRFLVPLKGYSYHDSPTGHLQDLAVPKPFSDYLREVLPDRIPVTVLDYHFNDAEFADAIVTETLDMIAHKSASA